MKALYSLLISIAMLCSSHLLAKDSDDCADCNTPTESYPTVTSGSKVFVDLTKYDDSSFQSISGIICRSLDRYRNDPESLGNRRTCSKIRVNIPRCDDNTKDFFDLRSNVRATVALKLKIQSNEQLENELPAILNKLSTYQCDELSIGDYKQDRRNMFKMAVYTGNMDSIYNNFIFKDYEYIDNGQRRLRIDINAVEIVNGKPETMLDYLDEYLENDYYFENTIYPRLGMATRGDVLRLRNTIYKMGAKKAQDL